MKTLQELADFFNKIVAVDEDGDIHAYDNEPTLKMNGDVWNDEGYWYDRGEYFYIPNWMVKYDGKWEDSLTFPRKIKEGV